MHFHFSDQQENFRQEVQSFLQEHLPAGWTQGGADFEEDDGTKDSFAKTLAGKMAQKGWITARWPTKYGGLGWTPIEQLIFAEEITKHKVPRTYIMDAGVSNVGPTIAAHGTEEQKSQWLPGISKAKDRWCQLFSEPNAGSDLAGLETIAREDGDEFVVNGTKIWSSMAHKADWGALLCRTDTEAPKHKGISYLVLDMTSPGIEFAPIVNICDVYHFNEVHLTDVRVPKSNLIGEKNRGWYSGATTLNLERSFIRHAIIGNEFLSELLETLNSNPHKFNPLSSNKSLRIKIAQMATELQVGRWLAYRVAWLQSQGGIPSYQSSMSKMFISEITQHLVELAMESLGLFSQMKEYSKYALLRGKAQQLYLAQRAITIGGGTTEIQRNLIALRGLGLPRG